MPQFAFDGIFAPAPSSSVVPQRQSNAGREDALFHEHLAQASRPPIASPTDRDQPTPKPPEYTTQPVRTEDRRNVDDQADANKEYSTRATAQTGQPTRHDKPRNSKDSDMEQADAGEPADAPVDSEDSEGNEALAAIVAVQQAEVAEVKVREEIEFKLLPESTDRVARTQGNANANVDLESAVPSTSTSTSQASTGTSDEAHQAKKSSEAAGRAQVNTQNDTATVAAGTVADEAAPPAEDIDLGSLSEESESPEAGLDEATTTPKADQFESATTDEAVARASHEAEVQVQNAADQVAQEGQADESTADRRKSKLTSSRRRDESQQQSSGTTTHTDKPATQPGAASTPSTVVSEAISTDNEVADLSTSTTVSTAERSTAAASPATSSPLTSESGTTNNTTAPRSGDSSSDSVVERTTQTTSSSTRESERTNVRAQLLSDVERFRIVQRVARAIGTSTTSADGGQMRLRLSPPELGSLKLDIVVRQGTVTAHVEAENAAARDVLLDNLPALRDRLAEQNIRLERFEVDLMRQSFDQSPQHTGEQDGNRSAHERSSRQSNSRGKTHNDVEHIAASAPIIQDGHVNIII